MAREGLAQSDTASTANEKGTVRTQPEHWWADKAQAHDGQAAKAQTEHRHSRGQAEVAQWQAASQARAKEQSKRTARAQAEHWRSTANDLLAGSHKARAEPQRSQGEQCRSTDMEQDTAIEQAGQSAEPQSRQNKGRGSPDMKHTGHSSGKAQPGNSLSTGRAWGHTGHK